MSRISNLIANPYDFEFFQAIRLLEQSMKADYSPVGYNGDPAREVVQFRSAPLLRFPLAQIQKIKSIRENLVEMQTACLGLYGANGLLPHHYTELIIQRLQADDHALQDFLDLFNHRMISLYYRAWKKSRFYIGYEQSKTKSGVDGFTSTLSALIGNITQSLAQRLPVADETLLFYAGYFANAHRPAHILQNLLSDYFNVAIKVESFQGKWFLINPQARTALSAPLSSQSNQLGVNAVLGYRIWDCNYYFYIAVGPLNYNEFLQFLPGSAHLHALVALTVRYVGIEWSFGIKLILKAEHVPGCQLKRQSSAALGRNTWLKTKPLTHDVSDTLYSIKI